MYERILTRPEIKEKAKDSFRSDRSSAILNWFLFGVIVWAAMFLVSLIGGNPFGGLLQELLYTASRGYSDEQILLIAVQNIWGAISAAIFSSILITVVKFVFAPVLEYGVYYNSVRLYRKDSSGKIQLRDLFIGFREKFGRNFGAYLWRALFLFLWGLIPIVGPIIVFVKTYAYCLTPFIVVEHPEIDARQALKESIKLTSGHKWDLFVLDLSFIGWNMLNVLTFGILGIFFVTPYKGLAFAGFYSEYEKNTIGVGSGLLRSGRRGVSESTAAPDKAFGAVYESRTATKPSGMPTRYCSRCGRPISGESTMCAECASERETRPGRGAAMDGGTRCSTKETGGTTLLPTRWHATEHSPDQDESFFKPPRLDE